MQTAPITHAFGRRGQPRRVGVAAAVLAGLLLVAAGCAAGSSNGSGDNRASATGDQDSVNTGASAPPGSQGRSVGSFTIELAACMRANGVPNFPDPNGQPGQLGPNSGIDPGSAQFQAAVNGPCKSLAPPQWLDSGSDSGPDSVPGGQ